VVNELAESSNNVTISGGEPIDQLADLFELCRQLKEQGKNIWVYTGNVVDPTKRTYIALSQYVDVIVDGRYVEELKDPNLLFRGSSNQRIIDLPKSVKEEKIILWEEC
jgi:anaerobic ribonucleoside-triphosphate reductase activating protein